MNYVSHLKEATTLETLSMVPENYRSRVSGPQPFVGLRTQQLLLYLRFYIACTVLGSEINK